MLRLFLIGLLLMIEFGCNRCRYGCENGICVKKVCQCESYWSGDACEINTLDQYTGTFALINKCAELESTDTVSLSRSSSMANALIWNGRLELTFQNLNEFSIDEQAYFGKKISGEGQMLLDKISMSVSYIDSTGTIKCLTEAVKISD